MPLDSESVLVSTNVFSDENGLGTSHLRSNLELDSTFQWLLWIVEALSVSEPSLVSTIMANPPVNMSVVNILSSMNIEASLTEISDSSSVLTEPSHLLKDRFLEWSDNGNVSVVVPVGTSNLDRDNTLSVGSVSDGLGSPVIYEPLSLVIWVLHSDSQSVLMRSEMLSNEQTSFLWHCRFDLESKAILEWIFWILDTLLVDNPSLVVTIVAWPPDDVVSDNVSSSVNI